MSTCISREGEYSEHETTEGNFICDRCGVLDKDGLFAERDALRAEVERLRMSPWDVAHRECDRLVARRWREDRDALRAAEARVAELEATVAKVRERLTPDATGAAQEGVWPTPSQWIAKWDRLDDGQRIDWAGRILASAQMAGECFRFDHDSQIEALRAEVEQLARWKSEALPVLSGLQEVGRALGLRLGVSITGRTALDAALDLRNRAEAAESRVAELEATVAKAKADHRVVYVEPGASAFVQAVCACGQKLMGSGVTNVSDLLAAHIRDAP